MRMESNSELVCSMCIACALTQLACRDDQYGNSEDTSDTVQAVLEQQHQFTIFNYHVYRHGGYSVYIDIITLKVITIRHERITTTHKLGLKLDMSY